MYTEEDLHDAWEAGQMLQYKEDAEYEGYIDTPDLEYNDFYSWLINFKSNVSTKNS